jgi:transposase
LRWTPAPKSYITRRQAEGKTRREAIRCLKRYAAREIYQIIASPRQAKSLAAA